MSDTSLRRDALRAWLPLVLVSVVGLALRLYGLGSQSFWFDEVQTLDIARLPLGEIALRAYRPPLYHYLLHLWGGLAPHTEFWLRLPSALFGAAMIPALFLAGRRQFDRQSGLAAAALAAVSPTLIWYSQELRMYSLLALEYALLIALLARLLRAEGRLRWGFWASLALVEALSLYTHYFALPFLFCWVGVAGLWLVCSGQRAQLGKLALTQAAVVVAFIPWLLVIWLGRGGTSDYIEAETLPVTTAVPGVRDFVLQSWRFYIGGVGVRSENALLSTLLWAAAAALGAALLIWLMLLIMRGVRALRRPPSEGEKGKLVGDLALLALVGGPFLAAAVMFKLRPGVVHPRHLMMVSAPLLLLMARSALAAWDAPAAMRLISLVGRALGGAALLAIGGVFIAAQTLTYIPEAAFLRPDARALARYVDAFVQQGDVVISPYRDYAFNYYYEGQAGVYYVETRVGDADLIPWFLPLAREAEHAVLLRWVHSYTDGRDLLPWLLQVNGRLLSHEWVAERWVSVYDIDKPMRMPSLTPVDVRFDPLRLVNLHLVEETPADQPLAVALEWELAATTPHDLKVSVRLQDAAGRLVAQVDRPLLSEKAQAPTSKWPAELRAHNYYSLNLPTGTAPAVYTVTVSAYSDQGPLGVEYPLGRVRVLPPLSFPTAFPAQVAMTRLGRELAPGLILEGVAGMPEGLRSGETLHLTLYWRAGAAWSVAQAAELAEPELRLVDGSGAILARQCAAPAYGQYPFSLWRAGELVEDRRRVRVPSETPSGALRVELALGDGTALALGQIAIEHSERSFELPPVQHPLDVSLGGIARLRGFDLSSARIASGAPLQLTLYWEALAETPSPTEYVVFAQLLDPASNMLAQHDGPPATNRWPTTGWVKGQVIADARTLTLKEGVRPGAGVLLVGLYDPASGARLPTSAGTDHIRLPVQIEVAP